MSWEARKGRGRYYTRSRRVGGKVVREYLGGGRIGEILAGFDMLKRDERLTEAAELKQSRAEEAALDAEVEQICLRRNREHWDCEFSCKHQAYKMF